jgi:hypothetical protein
MSRLPTPVRKAMDADSIIAEVIGNGAESALEELVDAGYLTRTNDVNEDRIKFSAREGLSWSEAVAVDCPVKKEILLKLIDNPQTFFVLYNTQKGKSAIVSLEIRKWASDPIIKVVAFLVVDNDKTLADQTKGGMEEVLNELELTAKVFLLSSNSVEVTLEGIRTYIDAYAGDKKGRYKMPVVVGLNNATQIKKILALMNHIKTEVETDRSPLRYGVVFDEADKVYPAVRDKKHTIGVQTVSFASLVVDSQFALYRLGFVTATEGDLMDEEYPECANAYMHDVPVSDPNYRAFHTKDALIKVIRHRVIDSNDVYAENILRDNAKHFADKIALANGSMSYRKVIINSGVKTGSMESFARRRVAAGGHAITVNQNGVTVYRLGQEPVRESIKGKRFGSVLFKLYNELGLSDKPLFIIGRRKVDRGVSFQFAPTDGTAGLVWTDMILGRIDDEDTAVQKAGRLAGKVAKCPQYPGKLTWWTDANTAAMIRHHNLMVDEANTLRGCSALQAVTRATVSVPKNVGGDVPSEYGPQIPVIVQLTDEEFDRIPTGHGHHERKRTMVLSLLRKSNNDLATKLDTYEDKEITAPRELDSGSYKTHIEATVNAATARRPCSVTSSTLTKEERKMGRVWNCFIDKHSNPKRLCFTYANPPKPESQDAHDSRGGGGGPISPE